MVKTALLFAGQGAQFVGMGKDLAEVHPTAKALFDRADEALGYGLSGICFSGPEEELVRTEHAQPAIYLVGWITLQLLREQSPSLAFDATAGLSLGEFTALAAADALGFEDGLRVVRRRGELLQEACEASAGGMAAIVGLDEEAVRVVCEQADVSLANLNCPGQIVVSGAADKMDAVGNKAARKEIAMIKVAAPRMACEIIDEAIQVHGGGGVSLEFKLAYAYGSNRTLRLADGPDEVHLEAIAKAEFRKND